MYNVPAAVDDGFSRRGRRLAQSTRRLAIARNTYHNQRIEGGNELVMANLQGRTAGHARSRTLQAGRGATVMLPNGTATDMVQQVHGRYSDTTPYDFMGGDGHLARKLRASRSDKRMFAPKLYGELRLFPNWPATAGAAEFHSLRAVGAFLVSAAVRDGVVEWIEITSEQGGPLRVHIPWSSGAPAQRQGSMSVVTDALATWETVAGETLLLMPNDT